MIHLIKRKATPRQVEEMLGDLGTFLKVAVDIRRGILAGGGEFHADSEEVLLDSGSNQADIWGADWLPESKEVRLEALINIRPRQGNRSMEIQDKKIRAMVEAIVRDIFGET